MTTFIPRTPVVMTGRPDFTVADSMLANQQQGITTPYRYEAGVDRLFLPYTWPIKLSDYWIGTVIRHGFHAFASRRHFQYGWYWAIVQFATMCATRQIFGQEPGAGTPPSTFLFDIRAANAYLTTAPWGPDLDVTIHLPVTYDTALNAYLIKVNRNNVLLWINESLVGVIVLGVQINASIPTWANVRPYSLTYLRGGYSAGPMMVGMEGTDYIEWTISPNGLVAVDGDPITPLTLPLYTENTNTFWDDRVIAAGSLTSHPIPTNGYERKTIFFRANGAGTLELQVYLINAWRVAKSIHALANELVIQSLNIETPIARCVFTPDAYPTTITEAVVSLS